MWILGTIFKVSFGFEFWGPLLKAHCWSSPCLKLYSHCTSIWNLKQWQCLQSGLSPSKNITGSEGPQKSIADFWSTLGKFSAWVSCTVCATLSFIRILHFLPCLNVLSTLNHCLPYIYFEDISVTLKIVLEFSSWPGQKNSSNKKMWI